MSFTCRLDQPLYQACKKDAHELCENFHFGNSEKDVNPQGMTLSCLYRHILPNMNPDPDKKVGCSETLFDKLISFDIPHSPIPYDSPHSPIPFIP